MSSEALVVPAGTRRERRHRATVEEIKQIARGLLAEGGADGVTIRAIAREMGMAAPGIYRYFHSLDDLLRELRADICAEVALRLRLACGAVPEENAPRRLIVGARELRGWALAHRSEFEFIRAPAQDGVGGEASDRQALGRHAGWVLGRIFAELMADLWRMRPFPVPEPGSLPPGLTRQLSGIRGGSTADLPIEAIAVMLRWWVRLYGLICMEALGHMESAMADGTAFFEGELADACGALGIRTFYMEP
ncbi:TetR/AcrR family transcriptional regulator [Streptomyces peucetius]|nr:TetR family transcriptional regulator [Streptomyces peucetius subsp. caesius ATCC 27952]